MIAAVSDDILSGAPLKPWDFDCSDHGQIRSPGARGRGGGRLWGQWPCITVGHSLTTCPNIQLGRATTVDGHGCLRQGHRPGRPRGVRSSSTARCSASASSRRPEGNDYAKLKPWLMPMRPRDDHSDRGRGSLTSICAGSRRWPRRTMRSSQGRAVGRSTSRAAWPSRLHRGLLSTILTAAPA